VFLVESGTEGITIEAEPSMGVRAATLSRLVLDDVEVGSIALLGEADGRRTSRRCAPRAWPGARSPWAPGRPCSTT
jgi:alkylation response protein AidB-like acyl-CoA dehydrogenase